MKIRDVLPPRFFNDSFTKGPAKGKIFTAKEFQNSLNEYYNIRGWNIKGIPTKKKLKELDLLEYFE